jgi:putative nucleotidyltransferase with HDIG domain
MLKKYKNNYDVVFLPIRKAAEILSISVASLKKFIRKGILKTWRAPNGRFYIRKKDLLFISGSDIGFQRLSYLENKSLLDIIEKFTTAFEQRHRFCRSHFKVVAKISIAIGCEMRFSARRLHLLYLAALLHDIGLIKINSDILNKSAPLTSQEYLIIQTHPLLGADIVESIAQTRSLAKIIRQHHERPDGEGYPEGLRKNDISLEAKIISLADAFASMTAQDSYKTPLSPSQALKEIEANIGNQFDSQVARIFLRLNRLNS